MNTVIWICAFNINRIHFQLDVAVAVHCLNLKKIKQTGSPLFPDITGFYSQRINMQPINMCSAGKIQLVRIGFDCHSSDYYRICEQINGRKKDY